VRFGIVTDAHIKVDGMGVRSFHNGREMEGALECYRLALRCLVEGGAEALVILGDLSHLGDARSLEEAVGLAAETGLPVWAVPGNHDVSERADALARAMRRIGADDVRLATPEGEAVGGSIRVAGLRVESEDWGFTSRSTGRPETRAWGEDTALLLSHFPILSSRFRVEGAGLRYAGDLESLPAVARPLLVRPAPTVVLSGHLHVRDAFAEGAVLQLNLAALVEPPFEAAVVDAETEGGRVSIRRRTLPVGSAPDGEELPVLSPSEERWVFDGRGWLREARGVAGRREIVRDPRPVGRGRG